MNNPLLTLFLFMSIAVLAGAVLWPQRGLAARLNRLKKGKKRILAEDCLKYIYDCEYHQHVCRQTDVAKTFSLSDEDLKKLISGLQSAGLIQMEQDAVRLTESGRADALQIIRIHRLLEQYMAEETSLKESEWHAAAEDREHMVSVAEAEAIAAHLGNPLFDPHGDPIPTAAGEMPDLSGFSLRDLTVGTFAKVTHIEDEPPEIYSRITALGIQPGTPVTCKEKDEDRMLLVVNGRDEEVETLLAKNITVAPMENEEAQVTLFRRLSGLKPGQQARVVGISKACRGQQRRRLMDLGLVPGSTISAELQSLGGDPTAYLIRGALIALRTQQADLIYIQDEMRN